MAFVHQSETAATHDKVRPSHSRDFILRVNATLIRGAFRSPRIKPVAVKSQEQQAILALHRAREQWKDTRTMRINGIRGMLREFGIVAPKGANPFLARLPQLLESHRERLPEPIRRLVNAYWAEAEELAGWMNEIERELKGIAKAHPIMRTLLEIPGIGPITATALYASIGNIHLFENGRQVASWLGLTPKENSSGSRRRLGRMSKRGNAYLRTLLIHGARSALTAAQGRKKKGMPLTRLEEWALDKSTSLRHSNQAAVGLANKMARIVWAVWAHERRFNGNHVPLPKAA